MNPLARLLPLILVLALPARAAELERYKNWSQSPEFVYLATDDEKKEWKKITTDADAERFIALFWARRNPDIKTAQNAFRDRFEALVKFADEKFALGRKRGALTERGKALILIGPATKTVARKSQASSGVPFGSPAGAATDTQAAEGGTTVIFQFLYEKAQLPSWADVQTLELKFEVDQTLLVERALDATMARRLEKKAAEMALVNPSLKEAPVYKTREQVEAEQKAGNEAAAEAAKGPALSAPVKEELEALIAREPSGALSLMGVAYGDGATRLMAQLFVPASVVTAPAGTKLAILVRDKAGKDAARVEEAAALQRTKGDFFVDRTIRVLPGDYDVSAVLLDVSGKSLAGAHRSVTIAALPQAFAASALLIAYNDFPAEAPKPEDPFTFSARKFVARSESKLDAADGLSYAVRIYNPSVDPVSKTVLLRRSMRVKPKNGAAIEVPQPPDEPAPAPDLKDGKTALAIDLSGNIVENNLGQYFRAGDYELRFTVTDAVSNQKVELTAPFTVVGTLPAPASGPKKK